MAGRCGSVARAYRRFVDARFARHAAGEVARQAGRPWAAADLAIAPANPVRRAEWEAACAPHARALWEAATAALEAYARADALRGSPPQPLPKEIAAFVADALRDLLATGNMPHTLTALRRRSGSLAPAMQKDRCCAVLYIRAVQGRLLPGRRPRATIARRFGVNVRSVERWNQEIPLAEADPKLCDPPLATRDGREALLFRVRQAAAHWRAFRHVKARDR